MAHGNMVGDQLEDRTFASLASVTCSSTEGKFAQRLADLPSDQSHPSSVLASVPLPPSPYESPTELISPACASAELAPEERNVGPGELGGSARSSLPLRETTNSMDGGPSSPQTTPAAAMPAAPTEDAPQVSFEDFATRYRQSQGKQTQRKQLEKRLRATKVSIGLSARIVRVGVAGQRGLVEALKYDDKANFVALYHTLHDLQESCGSRGRRDDPSLADDDPVSSPDLELRQSPAFFSQLSPQSRSDLLEILRLVRSDPQFLVDRLRSLTSSQLAALTSPISALDPGDPALPSASRARGQSSFSRNQAQSTSFKDHVYAFERTDPLSALLCNVFAAPLDPESPESRLRVEVWSSVCAQLISRGSSKFFPLIGHILSSWAAASSWKARPKFELYLMDILQTGAFLLEHIDTPFSADLAPEALDPLRTDVAEEFFASAVEDLFQVLDDTDAGFPHSVLQFSKAILRKLDRRETCNRFLEFLFVQWFFSKFLYGAITYPETHGLLLDFHIRKDAREKLLGQVGLQAYSQVFAILRSMQHFSIPRPSIKAHVGNMLSLFRNVMPEERSVVNYHTDPIQAPICLRDNCPSSFLMLSATDVLTLLDALFPRSFSPLSSSAASAGSPGWMSTLSQSYNNRPEPLTGSNLPRAKHETSPSPQSSSHHVSLSPLEIPATTSPGHGIGQKAARIRFELTDLADTGERATLERLSNEEWAIFSVGKDGHDITWSLLPDCTSAVIKAPFMQSDDETQSTTLELEENNEALQTAIVRLIQEDRLRDSDDYKNSAPGSVQQTSMSLLQRFHEAMSHCHHDSDFVGAHYWWNAARQLRQRLATASSGAMGDSRILGPMYDSCCRSLNHSRAIIDRCESDFVSLDQVLRRLQTQVKELMATLAKLRNKMWYMTDVKNSMRYEDAKHVAVALKTMVYSTRLYSQHPAEQQTRHGPRSLGGTLFQKPELQVMNMMKAPSSQGGPNKLSDEQVDLTRKWLSHNEIENFCKGEERIHRFCYEVRNSINRLVGGTMAETPVLWASELFQRERARYEGFGPRSFPGLSAPTTPRPSTTASEDAMPASHPYNATLPVPDPLSRMSQDNPALGRKSSAQSLLSDKWRPPRDFPSIDVSSIGGSPGRAASTSTADTCSTFWSVPQRHPLYATSVSSMHSRPRSMFSESDLRQPRRDERKAYGKTAFLDNLKQTLTSLLLSDLGSPVWSCGSETDAWFTNALDQKRIRVQMERRARIQKFYADYNERSKHLGDQRGLPKERRSRSLGPPGRASAQECSPEMPHTGSDADDQSHFSYQTVFRRLIEVFSRHGSPFVKLNALRDLRSLVIASLISSHDPASASETMGNNGRMHNGAPRPSHRYARHSFSDVRPGTMSPVDTVAAASSTPESVSSGCRRSDYAAPSEGQIVGTLRDLILQAKPKTLFRDLQFISAFVPGDQLNKTDRGTAFLQFGLAALSLKDEVCNSMVEIADRIVSQELSRRHPLLSTDLYPRPSHAIQDAAGMWIVTAKEGNPVAQRELAIFYLTHPELLPRVTLPLTMSRDTFKAEMMYRRDKDSKSDPQSMCLALHWMQLSASGGDLLARNRLREREEFESIA